MQVKRNLYIYSGTRLVKISIETSKTNIKNKMITYTDCCSISFQKTNKAAVTGGFCASLTNFNDKFLFLSGGCSGGEIYDRVEMYDISANKWTQAPKLNTARYWHSACCVDNSSIYVFFGMNH